MTNFNDSLIDLIAWRKCLSCGHKYNSQINAWTWWKDCPKCGEHHGK